MNKASLEVHPLVAASGGMRIVDVSAFYSPFGGGVKTYVEAKLRAAPRFGHELIVIVPGEDHSITPKGAGAFLVTVPGPQLPVDRRYRYFNDEALLHAVLDEWQPDHVEASSPWSSATMVGRWPGRASRSLVMHADPLATYAYRWFGRVAPTHVIDGWFNWFWRHLRGLGRLFDCVVCANANLTDRLARGGIGNAETVRMGVEPGIFSPKLHSAQLRRDLLAGLGLEEGAALLVGVGRLASEKRWEMVLRAVGECARKRPIGMILIGDGAKRPRLEAVAKGISSAALPGQIADRERLAKILASADALVHGCESETFCLAAAEARASGLPLIVPDRGGAADQVIDGAGSTYRSGRQRALEQAILTVIDRGLELQRAAASRAARPRTMDEHFAELFDRYQELAGRQAVAVQRPAASVVAGAA